MEIEKNILSMMKKSPNTQIIWMAILFIVINAVSLISAFLLNDIWTFLTSIVLAAYYLILVYHLAIFRGARPLVWALRILLIIYTIYMICGIRGYLSGFD
jgi:hypothetical protein